MPEYLREREVFAALVAIVVGLVLLVVGLIAGESESKALGVSLMIGGVATLGVSRGLAKMGGGPKPPTGGVVTLLTLSLLALGGCCSRGYMHVDTLAGIIEPVAERHDAYVAEDAALSDLERRTYLRSTELLRKALLEAQEVSGGDGDGGGS